ncbi:MAG: CoA synthetase [Gammaproteobacteria bacterium]|nr:CoA synthetase [Gammaproteobacteria bacterium]
MSAFTPAELMAVTMARLLDTSRHVAVGALSPLPATAALLAQALRPALRVTILGSRRHLAFTDGGRELFDCAAQGRIDTFFLSGVQIDGDANINLVATGDYAQPTKRFPGSFGSAYLYSLVKTVILFKPEHTPRVLVPRVDFISAAGVSPPHEYRPGGPRHLVTGLALFDFIDRRFVLRSVHPGHTADEVARATGFEYAADAVTETPAPSAEELAALRGPVRSDVAETYPRFAAKSFGV